MKRVLMLGVLIGAGALSIVAAGYQGPPAAGANRGGAAPAALQTIKVRDNLYMITNAGGNTAVFITAAGVVLVDTKNPNTGQSILDQVRTVTDKPVTMVINTHAHADHTGSNEFFKDSVVFVAQENTKSNMEKMPNFAADKAKFLPSRTFKDTMTLGAGADQIVLYYFGRAHTSGDAFVVFPALRAMHSGDAFASKSTPLIDTENGGSAVEYGKTLAKAAAGIKNVDTIINGHITSGPTPFADLQTYADFNNDFITWVQGEIAAGKTAEQAATEFKIPTKYAGYTLPSVSFFGGVAGNINTAYAELKK